MLHYYQKNEQKESVKPMISCCKEHIELALDVIVDEYETPPVMKELTESEQLSTTCEYCEKPAIYMVSN